MYTFRNFLAAGLLILSAAACSKKEEPTPAPAPTTGSIEGTISPANALTSVTATNVGGLTFPSVPAASGVFTVANLSPGTYLLTFAARTGFLTPASRSVAVVAGQTAPAGTVVVAPEPPAGVSGTINPVGAVTQVEVTAANGTLTSAVPGANGAFSVSTALGGATVHFVVATGFVQVPNQTVTLTPAAPIALLGTINVGAYTITGTVNPSNAVTRVEVTAANGALTSGSPTAGDFEVSASLGTSRVHFVMAAGYAALSDRTVTLTASSPVALLGYIYASPLPTVGTLTYDINGSTYTATSTTVSAAAGGILRIDGLSPNAQTPLRLVLSAGSFSGVGTYTLGGTNTNNFGQLILLQNTQYIYQTSTTGPSGTLTISAYNAAARTIAGTFSFNTATPTVVPITNGRFNLQY